MKFDCVNTRGFGVVAGGSMVKQEPREGTALLGSLKMFEERPGQGGVPSIFPVIFLTIAGTPLLPSRSCPPPSLQDRRRTVFCLFHFCFKMVLFVKIKVVVVYGFLKKFLAF